VRARAGERIEEMMETPGGLEFRSVPT